MITIWKYKVPIEDNFTLDLQANAKILSFQMQKGVPTIWCIVDTKVNSRKRHFRLCGTGHELESEWWKFIGTVQLYDDRLVYHLFEKVNA